MILQNVFEKIVAVSEAERWSYIPSGEEPVEIKYPLPSPFQPLIVPDVSCDPQGAKVANAHPEYGLRSIAYLPIQRSEEHQGFLQLINPGSHMMEIETIVQLNLLFGFTATLAC